MNKNNIKIFDLKEVGYTDLEGNFITINFVDHKDFANALFANATSIEMDDFARMIHKDGKAELNEKVEQDLPIVVAMCYRYRIVEAIKETINKIKDGKNN